MIDVSIMMTCVTLAKARGSSSGAVKVSNKTSRKLLSGIASTHFARGRRIPAFVLLWCRGQGHVRRISLAWLGRAGIRKGHDTI